MRTLLELVDDSAVDTPLLVYREADVLNALDVLRRGLAHHFPGEVHVHFAVKSCYSRGVLRSLQRTSAGVEVMSELEYHLARACGFEGPQILLNGLGRSGALFRQAIRENACIIVDSEGDIERLEAALAESELPARLGVRLALELATSPQSPYARAANKLGLRPGSTSLDQVLRLCQSHPKAQLELLHAHFTINEKDAGTFRSALGELRAHLDDIERAYAGIHFTTVDIGGGIGTFGPDELPQAEQLFREIGQIAAELFPDRELAVEPGRYLSNAAGYVIATVLDVKRLEDRWAVISNATTNVLIPIPTARHRLLVPPETPDGAYLATLTDGITSPDNVVIPLVRLAAPLQPGNRILIGNCGAYTDVLSHFWVFDPFPVSFLTTDGGLVEERTRETLLECRRTWIGI